MLDDKHGHEPLSPFSNETLPVQLCVSLFELRRCKIITYVTTIKTCYEDGLIHYSKKRVLRPVFLKSNIEISINVVCKVVWRYILRSYRKSIYRSNTMRNKFYTNDKLYFLNVSHIKLSVSRLSVHAVRIRSRCYNFNPYTILREIMFEYANGEITRFDYMKTVSFKYLPIQ